MRELFKNCVALKEENGWYLPTRFTEKQISQYKKNEFINIRSLAPSGVHLAFTSEAKSVEIEYSIGVKARDWACFDVLVDGFLFDSKILDSDKGIVTLNLSGDDNARTEIYLPHLVEIKIKAPVSDAPLLPIKEKRDFYLALGDSITQGMVAVHPSFAYPISLARHFNYDLLNCGVGSICFNKDELDFCGREPKLITLALGCNDWSKVPITDIEKIVCEYVDKLVSLYECRNIYAILPIWRSDETSVTLDSTFREFREEIKKAYLKYDFIKIVDGYKLVPHDKKFFNDPREEQCHPNEMGFLYYAERLIKNVK